LLYIATAIGSSVCSLKTMSGTDPAVKWSTKRSTFGTWSRATWFGTGRSERHGRPRIWKHRDRNRPVFRQREVYKGTALDERQRFTSVLIKRNGQWLIVAEHCSKLAAADQ